MTQDEIVQKFKDMGFEQSCTDKEVWMFMSGARPNWVGIDTIITQGEYKFGIIIAEKQHSMGTVFPYILGIRKIQEIIQEEIEKYR